MQAEITRAKTGFQRSALPNASENFSIIHKYCLRDFLRLGKRRQPKTARHLSANNFRLIFGADDAALLTQGKEDKAKSSEKCC